MATFTADETKQRYIEKMGKELGTQYSALWQEVAVLYVNWGEYVELFGTKSERINLLNQAAGHFFRMVQNELWETTLLHIARLTDPSKSLGRDENSNLTIQNLAELTDDTNTKQKVAKLVKTAVKQAHFCRDWRNRHIAHRDLKLALEQSAVPLAAASRKQVNEALKAIADAMNALEEHYCQSETRFDLGSIHHGAVSLLYVIDAGLRREEELASDCGVESPPRTITSHEIYER
jgi:hypothetical protein